MSRNPFDAIPPHDEEAEAAVLGACIEDTRCAEIVFELLEARHFHVKKHERLFKLFREAFEEADLDLLTLQDAARRRGLDETYLEKLLEYPRASGVERHIRLVKERWREREMEKVAAKLMQRNGSEPELVLYEGLEALERLALESQDLGDEPQDLQELAEPIAREALEGRPVRKVLPTGVAGGKLDDLLGGGVTAGEFVIVASLPKFGKSTLVNTIMQGVRRLNPAAGEPLLITTEMPPREIACVSLALAAKVHTRGIVQGNLTDLQKGNVQRVLERKALAGVKIIYMAGKSIGAVRALAKRHKRRHGLPLLVLDLARGLECPKGERVSERHAELSHALKRLPIELDCSVWACVHLNREFGKSGRRPTKEDIRDSNGWSEDGDRILLLHREGYKTTIIQDGCRIYSMSEGENELTVEWKAATGEYIPMEQEVPV